MSRFNRYDSEQADAVFVRLIESIRDDRLTVVELDADTSEALDYDAHRDMVTLLADIGGEYGLLRRLADRIGDLPAGPLDDFARLCRLADSMHAMREQAITKEAQERFDSCELERAA